MKVYYKKSVNLFSFCFHRARAHRARMLALSRCQPTASIVHCCLCFVEIGWVGIRFVASWKIDRTTASRYTALVTRVCARSTLFASLVDIGANRIAHSCRHFFFEKCLGFTQRCYSKRLFAIIISKTRLFRFCLWRTR